MSAASTVTPTVSVESTVSAISNFVLAGIVATIAAPSAGADVNVSDVPSTEIFVSAAPATVTATVSPNASLESVNTVFAVTVITIASALAGAPYGAVPAAKSNVVPLIVYCTSGVKVTPSTDTDTVPAGVALNVIDAVVPSPVSFWVVAPTPTRLSVASATPTKSSVASTGVDDPAIPATEFNAPAPITLFTLRELAYARKFAAVNQD